MCTAITFQSRDHYFGRNLDYEVSFGEKVVLTPRNFPFSFRHLPLMDQHYGMVGMAAVAENFPLYYDAVNEKGLAMAGLLFSGNSVYHPPREGAYNPASFELIPWVLGQCADLRDVRRLLEKTAVTGDSFGAGLPSTPLHWMIADREGAMVVESVASGLKLYDNPAGVLTNSPDFPYQLLRLEEYQGLTPDHREGHSRGLGAVGLPGDWSSSSRFVRAAVVRRWGRCGGSEEESVSHFFRLLQSVAVPKGCVRLKTGDAHTMYSCCCNQDRMIYYYSTYEDPRICAVPLADPEGKKLRIYDCKIKNDVI